MNNSNKHSFVAVVVVIVAGRLICFISECMWRCYVLSTCGQKESLFFVVKKSLHFFFDRILFSLNYRSLWFRYLAHCYDAMNMNTWVLIV